MNLSDVKLINNTFCKFLNFNIAALIVWNLQKKKMKLIDLAFVKGSYDVLTPTWKRIETNVLTSVFELEQTQCIMHYLIYDSFLSLYWARESCASNPLSPFSNPNNKCCSSPRDLALTNASLTFPGTLLAIARGVSSDGILIIIINIINTHCIWVSLYL